MYFYFLTRDTERELDNELAYSAQRWGKRHALSYAIELQEKFRTIAKNPYAFAERPDILPNIRLVSHKGNQIFFTIREEHKQVIILAFLSIHQQPNSEALARRLS